MTTPPVDLNLQDSIAKLNNGTFSASDAQKILRISLTEYKTLVGPIEAALQQHGIGPNDTLGPDSQRQKVLDIVDGLRQSESLKTLTCRATEPPFHESEKSVRSCLKRVVQLVHRNWNKRYNTELKSTKPKKSTANNSRSDSQPGLTNETTEEAELSQSIRNRGSLLQSSLHNPHLLPAFSDREIASIVIITCDDCARFVPSLLDLVLPEDRGASQSEATVRPDQLSIAQLQAQALQLFPADLAGKSFHLQTDRNGLKVDIRTQEDLLKVSKSTIAYQKDIVFSVAIDKGHHVLVTPPPAVLIPPIKQEGELQPQDPVIFKQPQALRRSLNNPTSSKPATPSLGRSDRASSHLGQSVHNVSKGALKRKRVDSKDEIPPSDESPTPSPVAKKAKPLQAGESNSEDGRRGERQRKGRY